MQWRDFLERNMVKGNPLSFVFYEIKGGKQWFG